MAFKDYGNSAVTITEESPTGDPGAIYGGTGFNRTISQIYNGSEPDSTIHAYGGSNYIVGDINYQQLGNALPLTALITKLTITQVISLVSASNVDASGYVGEASAECSANVGLSWDTTNSPVGTPIVEQAGDIQVSESPTDIDASVSDIQNPATFEIDFTTDPYWLGLFPAGYLTYAEFLENFETFILQLTGSGWVYYGGPPGTINYGGTTAISTASFNLQVIYTATDSYSWYIKPTQIMVNGQLTDIIDDAGDIVQVPDGDAPPDGYVFYGYGWEVPEIIYYWWENPEQYEFYINSPISPGPQWIQMIGDPVCTGCTSMTLGILDILIADASGIYTLVVNQRHDTLYNRATNDTSNVKIPDPTFITGFLP